MLEKDHPEIPLKRQAELLGISYSSLFYEPVPPSLRELAIKRRIDEIYTACPFYGSRKIAVLLRPEFGVSRPTVQAYMREMGIFGLVPGPNTSKSTPAAPNLPVLAAKCDQPSIPITSGALTSPTSACSMAGYISPRCWTGIPAM